MDVFFTSDTHYGHRNIIKYCKRPFLKDPTIPDPYEHDWNLDTDTMNETMIQNWNKVVKPGDLVYHLGDFFMGSKVAEKLREYRARLQGEITLILGNHDKSAKVYLEAGFERVMRSFTCNGPRAMGLIVMRHHPPKVRDGNVTHLCGHVHEEWARRDNVYNVGVDVRNFTPVSIDEILATP